MSDKPKRHWLKVGLELEGGWDHQPEEIARKCVGAETRHDGSVGGTAAMFHGEVVTRPHETVEGALKDLEKMYPEYVNDSCGFHVHTSFSPMDTTCLADPAFWQFFLARWRVWADKHKPGDLFLRRMAGQKTGPRGVVYAEPKFIPEIQLAKRDKAKKYTAVNFIAYHDYKTIECRIFPMWGPKQRDLAEKAVHELLDIYETYLNEVGFVPIELTRKSVLDGDTAREEFVRILPDRTCLTYDEVGEVAPLVRGERVTYAWDAAPDALMYMKAFRERTGDDEGPTP